MAQYDGSIRINTEIDTKKASSQMLSLENRISKTAEKISGLRSKLDQLKNAKVPTQEYKDISNQIQKATTNIDRLINKQQAMVTNGQRGTKEFEKIDSQIEELHEELKYANEELDQLVESGEAFQIGSSPEEIQKVTTELRQAEQEMSILKTKYSEVGDQDFNQTAKKIENLFSSVAGSIGQTGTKLGATLSEVNVAVGATVAGLSIAFGLVVKALQTAISVAKKLATVVGTTLRNAFSKLKDVAVSSIDAVISVVQTLASKVASAVSNIVSNITSMAVSLAKSVVNLSSITSSIEDALTNISSVNLEYEEMQILLSTIKSQTGAAFAPLVSVAIPYIKEALSWVLKLVNAFSQLIALASGKKTWSKAVVSSTGSGSGSSSSNTKTAEEKQLEAQKEAEEKAATQAAKVEERNAKALEKQAKAYADAEEAANHYLSPIDEINKYTEKQDVAEVELEEFDPSDYLTSVDDTADAVASGVGDGISYIEEAIDSNMEEMFDWLKEMWEKGDFTELGESIAKWLQEALEKIPWDKIKATANKLGKSLATLLNGIFGNKQLANDIGKTFAETINTIFEFAYGFLEKFDSREFASFLTEGINSAFENIDWDLIKRTFGEFSTKLAEWIDEFTNTFSWDDLAEFITNSINTVIESLQTFVDNMGQNSTWGNLGESIGSTIRNIFENIDWEGAGTVLREGFRGVWDALVGFVQGLTGGNTLTEVINNAFDFADSCTETLMQTMDTIGKNLYELLSKLVEEDPETGESPAELMGRRLAEQIEKIVDNIDPETWDNLLNALIKLFGDVIKSIWDKLEEDGTFTEFVTKLSEILKGLDLTPILDAILPIAQELAKKFLDDWVNGVYAYDLAKVLGSYWKAVGSNMVQGITGGFKEESKATASDSAQSLFDDVTGAIESKFEIGSPSKALNPYGQYMLEGIIEGFKAAFVEWAEVMVEFFEEYVRPWFSSDTWAEILDSFTANITTFLENIGLIFDEKWTAIKDKVAEIWDAMKSGIEEKMEAIKSLLDRLSEWKSSWDSAWDGFKEKVNSIWEEIKSIIGSAVEYVSGLIDSVISAISSVQSAASSIGSLGGSKKTSSGGSGGSHGFANGTVIPASHGEFMARVGDNNRETEVISPLSVIKQALHEELAGLKLGGGDVTIRQYLDGMQIAESVVRAGRLEQNATGENIFALG